MEEAKLQRIKTHLTDSHLDAPVIQDGLSTSVLQRVVSNNNDAMNILFEAALQESNNTSQNKSTTDYPRSIVPELTDADVLRIWNACRFVRMGWFSAQEAVVLMDLYVTQPTRCLGCYTNINNDQILRKYGTPIACSNGLFRLA